MSISCPSFCVNIDGKFWDWGSIGTFYTCPARLLEKNRSGFDMQSVKMSLGKKYIYIYLEGKSVTGKKADSGWGAKKTSVRISFKSAQSPLNRVRIATDPASPGKIKLSYPQITSRTYGSKQDKYWALAKYGNKYAFEIKIPIHYSKKGVHAGVPGGPIIKPAGESSRNYLADVLINTVDVKIHRLVDTVEFPIRRGQL